MDIEVLRKKSMRYIIGMTAGRSCRGIDAALVRVKGSGQGVGVKLIKSRHFPHPSGIRTRLMVPRKDAHEVGLLNFELGELLASAASEMCRFAHADLHEVDFVASEGFTTAHCPPRGGEMALGTFQIGEPAVIAERAQLSVVSNFQARDVAAGGQGGPLGAYANWQLFYRKDRTVACLHLGGTTTLTVAPPNLEEVMGFEVGPGNIILDGAIRLLSGGSTDMDGNGTCAAKGIVVDEFLEYLLDHSYFAKVPPKSIASEEFSIEQYLRDALAGRKDISSEDLMATVTSAQSYAIVRAYNRFVKPQYDVSRIILSGGGAANDALVSRIKNGIPDATIRKTDEYGMPSAAFDAVGIAILGNELVCDKAANVPSATGADHPVLLGQITPV